jgi:hypothetical protein
MKHIKMKNTDIKYNTQKQNKTKGPIIHVHSF